MDKNKIFIKYIMSVANDGYERFSTLSLSANGATTISTGSNGGLYLNSPSSVYFGGALVNQELIITGQLQIGVCPFLQAIFCSGAADGYAVALPAISAGQRILFRTSRQIVLVNGGAPVTGCWTSGAPANVVSIAAPAGTAIGIPAGSVFQVWGTDNQWNIMGQSVTAVPAVP